jgi:hypothetical protein
LSLPGRIGAFQTSIILVLIQAAMQNLTFLELAKKVLEEAGKPMTSDEIWQAAAAKQYDKLLNTSGKTPWATMGAQLFVAVRDKKDTPFVKLGARPSLFFLKQLMKGSEEEYLSKYPMPVPLPVKKSGYLERELHSFLAHAHLFLKAHTKTLDHTKSVKKEYGEWVHPDMVGAYFPLDDWKPEVIELGAALGNVSVKLFSFEIKRELNFGNLRESFFQTVSNSSWAHEGFLVAAEISTNEEFLSELGRLSTSFGIGVIRLNVGEPNSSETIFPARTKEYLDWDTINKLTMNPDFREFLKRVKTDISSKEVRKEKYDKVFDAEELLKNFPK